MTENMGHENYVRKLKEKHNGEIEVLGKYINTYTKISHTRKTCGHTWNAAPGNVLLDNFSCPECRAKAKAKAKQMQHDEYKQEVYKLYNGGVEVLEQYINSLTSILHEFPCGHIKKVTPKRIREGYNCLKCRGSLKRKTHDQYQKELFEKHNGEIEALEKYITSSIKILHKHSKCGTTWYATPNTILSGQIGQACPKCKIKTVKLKTHDQYILDLKERRNNEFEVLEKYIKGYIEILHKHTTCGYIWEVKPNDMLTGKKCPNCSSKKMTDEEYRHKISDKFDGKIEVLERYVNENIEILHKHTICNHMWLEKPCAVLNMESCPNCEVESTNTFICSRGEEFINNVLTALTNERICFSTQYKIDECKNKHPLPFDFAIFNDCDDLVCLIEYDGKQHFEPTEYFGGEEEFKYRQKNDSIKNKYCAKNGIDLIRIPYWKSEEEILGILSSIINKCKSEYKRKIGA